MRAAVQHDFGDNEVVTIDEVPDPVPGPDEVVVAVVACALNRLDLLQRNGPPVVPNFTLPHISGMDIAGRVVDVGSAVEHVEIGDEVLLDPVVRCGRCGRCTAGLGAYCAELRTVGSTRDGGFAELVAVPAENVFSAPEQLPLDIAAAIPVAAMTAWHSIVRVGRITAGETMLVHGAGSGVSTAAIGFAKARGVRVITTVSSPEKLGPARSLGADVVIDRSATSWQDAVREETDGAGVDFVFDHVGSAVFVDSVLALRIEGRLVFAGTTTGDSVTLRLPMVYHAGKSLLGAGGWRPSDFPVMLAEYAAAGLEPVIDSRYELGALHDAYDRLESGSFFGKILLTPGMAGGAQRDVSSNSRRDERPEASHAH